MKRLFFAAALLLTAALSYGQQMQNLPNDPEVRVGKLENGLTYYIRHNENPAQRAEFYLATNVGAIQETPDQDGLAHFLEHMCFNGTKNFPGKSLLDWLQSIGASFGGNVNASTGVEQTIYMLTNIPLVRPTVVDSCILIMHDYSHFVLNQPEEIDKERGVIIEERRTRRDASWRLHEQSLPYYYGDSKYAGCTLIGSQQNLETFKPESLVNFYKTWYRPDMQALIVVGDIDVDEVEAKIASIFADIPAAENPKAKDVIAIPDNVEPIVGVLTDPEMSNTVFEFIWKSEAAPEAINSTPIGLMTELLKDIVTDAFNVRLQDIAARPDAPLLMAAAGIGKLCETCEAVQGQVVPKTGLAAESLELFLTEIEKLRRYGFTDDEIERSKLEILSRYENAAKRASTRTNSQFVYPLIQNFFDNMPYMVPEQEYEFVGMLMQQLTPVIVNQVAQGIITDENLVVLLKAPTKEIESLPDEAAIRAAIERVKDAEIERNESEEIPDSFLDASRLKGSKVKKNVPYIYDSRLVTLANGVQVVFYPTEVEKNVIRLTLSKKGGKSLIADQDLYSFEDNIWQLFLSNSGVSGFSNTLVGKMLAGKNVSVTPFISAYTHGVRSSSNVKDFETALQLAYLYFADPRFDEDEYMLGINQIRTLLPNLEAQPNWKLMKEVYKTFFNSPRDFSLSEEVLDKASLATIERVYRQLFKDAAGATVVVAGDFKTEEILPLIQKYIGSLPKGKKATDWSYRGDGIVNGVAVNDFSTDMQTPMVTVDHVYKVNKPFSVKADAAYDAFKYILDIIYVATLREDEGGTYGASVSVSLNREPNPHRLVEISFTTNPSSADKLRSLAVAGIRGLAENGPSAEDFDKAVQNMLKNIPESKLRVAYWASVIDSYIHYGYDYVTEYEAAVKALTPADVQAVAAEVLSSGNDREIVMRPANAAEAE